MPTTEDNINFLYLIITEDDSPALDMDTIATKLGLNKAAASKRWSRLKGAMNAGENPGPNAYKFLWLALKHSQRSKTPDWKAIAAKCNTTPGAAAKRYSRMKTAWENGDDPNSPPKTATRKRGASTSTKNATVKDDDNFRYTPDSDDQKTDANYKPSKKRKTATPKKATPKKLPVAKTVSPKEIAASPKKEPQETQVSDIIQTEPNSAADTFTFEDVYAGTNNIYSGTLGGLNASGTVPNLNNGLAINNIASQPSTGDADFNSHFMSPMYTHQQAYYNPAPQASFNGTGGIATSNASMSNHYTMPAYLSAATHAAPSKPIPAFQDTDLFPDLLDFGGYRNTGVGIDGNVAASGVTGSTPAEMVTNNNTGDPAVSDGYNAQVGSQARPVNDLFSSSSSSGWMMMMNGDEEV